MRLQRPPIGSLAAVVIGLLVLGCADDRASSPHGDSTVPTAHFSDQLILKVSDSVSVDKTGLDTSAVTLHFSDSLLGVFGVNPEIHLTHIHAPESHLRFEILAPLTSTWIKVDGPYDFGPLPPSDSKNFRLLSGWAARPLDFLDSTNALRARGTFRRLFARLVTFAPAYRPQLIHERSAFVDLAWLKDELIANVWYRDRDGSNVELIQWRDSDGIVSRSRQLIQPDDERHLVASAARFWSISRHQGLLELDETGGTSEVIQLRPPSDRLMIWNLAVFANGRIWVPGLFGSAADYYAGAELLGLNPDKSSDSAYTVFDTAHAWPRRVSIAADIDWDGSEFQVLKKGTRTLTDDGVIYPDDLIFRVSTAGEIMDSIAIPVRAESMAWDGEAYWIAHHGTPDLPSTDILLSRFYPR